MELEHRLALGQNSVSGIIWEHTKQTGNHLEQKQRGESISTDSYLKTSGNDDVLTNCIRKSKYYEGKQINIF